jgi:precorrin-6B methylase 1
LAKCLARLQKKGHDGADILLAKAMLEDDLENRFERVVIASGDGGLAPFVQSLVSKFKAVLVVSQPSAIALLMARSGGSVRYLKSEFALVS